MTSGHLEELSMSFEHKSQAALCKRLMNGVEPFSWTPPPAMPIEIPASVSKGEFMAVLTRKYAANLENVQRRLAAAVEEGA